MSIKPKKPAPASGVSAAQLREIALSFPGVSEGTSYGRASYLVGKKFFTRLRSEDDSVVLIVGSIDERDMLLESDPRLFHITEHYRNYASVLARMAKLDTETLRAMLDRRWRAMVPKKLTKQADENPSTGSAERAINKHRARGGKKVTEHEARSASLPSRPRPPRLRMK
ncbi:MAG TPA: MmcQ/YjbR family DNA-binding protein [Rhizomicrobium sp.]|jgi:hypothetical protein